MKGEKAMEDPNIMYLGDGLYAEYDEDDGFWLRTTFYKENDEHSIYLNSDVLEIFFAFIEKMRGD